MILENIMLYLIELIILSVKKSIRESINRNFARIRINSYNSLPIEKKKIFHNVTIFLKSVVNKDKNNYYYNIFLEKRFK